MRRTLYEAEHDAFRDMVRAFVARHVVPHHDAWEQAGIVDRSLWLEAGKQGLLGTDVPEEYGGGGIADYRYQCVIGEELTRVGATGVGFQLHNDVVAPYLLRLTTEEQKARWLPGFVSGEMITAIAMTEPGTGSDLQGITTTARRDGDGWVLSGSKTFITNGISADLVIVVARTDPEAGSRGFSLLAVERGMPGFERGRNLDKVGLKAQDTAELFFDEVRVPAGNLLGPRGRRVRAPDGVAAAGAAVDRGRRGRRRPGRCSSRRWRTARSAPRSARRSAASSTTASGSPRCRPRSRSPSSTSTGRCSSTTPAGCPPPTPRWPSGGPPSCRSGSSTRCVQLHGGYGYMREYPVAKAYLDSRVQTIYGGTTEVMKEIIGRSLGV